MVLKNIYMYAYIWTSLDMYILGYMYVYLLVVEQEIENIGWEY